MVIQTPVQPQAKFVEVSVINLARSRVCSRPPSPEDLAERPAPLRGNPESGSSLKEPVSGGSQVAVGEETAEEQVEQQDKDTPAWVQSNRTMRRTGWLWNHHNQVHWLDPSTVDGQVMEVCLDGEQRSFGNLPISPSERAAVDVEVNEQSDMDAAFSAEEQLGLPQFGYLPPAKHHLQPTPAVPM